MSGRGGTRSANCGAVRGRQQSWYYRQTDEVENLGGWHQLEWVVIYACVKDL